MRHTAITTVAVTVAALLLSGCVASPSAIQADPEPSASMSATVTPAPTPTIPTGPVMLDVEAAGERYLKIMCQRNDAINALNDAYIAEEENYYADRRTDVSEINATAKDAMRITRMVAELLDDDYYVWPDAVAKQLQTLRTSEIADGAPLSEWSNANTFEESMSVQWMGDPGSAAQEIRYELGLSADTVESCKGFKNGTAELHAEMVERAKYLATFEQAD